MEEKSDADIIARAMNATKDKEEVIEFILAQCADFGSEKGALISIRQWRKVSRIISRYIDILKKVDSK